MKVIKEIAYFKQLYETPVLNNNKNNTTQL